MRKHRKTELRPNPILDETEEDQDTKEIPAEAEQELEKLFLGTESDSEKEK